MQTRSMQAPNPVAEVRIRRLPGEPGSLTFLDGLPGVRNSALTRLQHVASGHPPFERVQDDYEWGGIENIR